MSIHVTVENSSAETLFDGDVGRELTLHDLSSRLPEAPSGKAWTLFQGAVKVPQTTALGDISDEASIKLNASYKVGAATLESIETN